MKRSLFGTVALAAVAVTAVLIGTAAAKPPAPPAPTNSSCPTSGTKNLKAALNVTASYGAGAYSVERFGPAASTSLVKYCVYANVAPTALDATAVGADGSAWTESKLARTFAFSRPGGEPTNLALDGTKQQVGTATFGTPPSTNDIVLHISDGGQCFNIYGVVTPTCFVLPGTKSTGTLTLDKTVTNDNGGQATEASFQGKIDGNNVAWDTAVTLPAGPHTASETTLAGYTAGDWGGACAANGSVTVVAGQNVTCTITNNDNGPYCDTITGNSNAAYNAIPNQVENCGPPSYAFEGNSANEFGDEVNLNMSLGNKIQSMRVDFQSYGCSASGRWNGGNTAGTPEPCVTTNSTKDLTPGADTFTIPGGITASIYDPAVSLTEPIATSAINPSIPFRPSADPTNCSGPTDPLLKQGANDDGMRWFDPVSGTCKYSLSVVLTFPFADQILPSTVVWTVQFNTSHSGYNPIVTNLPAEACIVTDEGCGYDHLNVGHRSYTGAPFVGTDEDEDVWYQSNGNGDFTGPFVALHATNGHTGNRPLAEIVLLS